jgi:hypothetical protein
MNRLCECASVAYGKCSPLILCKLGGNTDILWGLWLQNKAQVVNAQRSVNEVTVVCKIVFLD